MRPGHETTRAWASLLALAVAVGTSACNGPAHISPPPSLPSSSTTTPSPTTTTTSAPTSTLAIEARVVPVLTDNFNPFDTTAPLGEMGVPSYIYEPLLQYSELQINQYYPWLASSWSFSSSGLTITFNLRPKVTWDDGSAFTAADVAYTFNLLKANPGIDEGIPVVSAQATNPSTFVLTLSQPGYSLLYNIAHVPIVKAGYAAGAAPRGFVDRVPDGTGPYELAHPEDFSSRQVVLTARPGYWQGPPPIRTLVFPAFSDRAAVVTALREGKLDWAGEEMGGDVSSYTDKDKVHNHFWAPPVGCVALELNLVKPAFADLAVRKAISDAIDRAALSRQLGGGAGSAVSTLSCLVLPADDQFLSPSDTADVPAQPEPGSIAALMAAAGYHMSTQGYWTSAARRRLYVNIEDPAGSSLAEAAADVAQQLNAAGFDASSSAPPAAKWRRDIVAGDFDASVLPSASGPSPYYMYEQWLDPALIVGGQASRGNYERLGPATVPAVSADAVHDLRQFAGSLSGSPGTVSAVKALGVLVADDLPVIPLLYNVAWGEYSTRDATGWPDSEDPYEPATPQGPFAEYTVLQLSAASP